MRLFGGRDDWAVGAVLMPEDRADELTSIFERIRDSGSKATGDEAHEAGAAIDISAKIVIIRMARSRIVRARRVIGDISRQKQAELASRTSEGRC